MGQIVTEVYDAFRAANVQDDLAKAAAGAIAGREDLVTKLDLERESPVEIVTVLPPYAQVSCPNEGLRSIHPGAP